MDESGRQGIKMRKRMKSSSSKCSADYWWASSQSHAGERSLLVVDTFDLSVYWLANSNLNGFELDFIFLSTITFI